MAPLPPRGQILKRAVTLRRYENQLAVDVAREVKRARDQLAAILQRQDVTAVSAGRTKARLNSIAAQADQVLHDAYVRIDTLTRRELYDLGGVAADATAGDVTRAAAALGVDLTNLGLPTPDQLRAIIVTDPIQGAVMKEWWSRQETQTANAFRTQVQIGLTRSETLSQIVQRIRGTSIGGGRFAGGVMETSTRAAMTLARTAVNEVYNQASQLTYEANSDLLQGWEFVATLDERTCSECADLDGQIYPVGDDRDAPPIHFNCVLGDTRVTPRSGVSAATVRWIDGEVIVLRTAGGRELTCTPNHPILTPDGWVAAQALNLGDEVVCDVLSQWPSDENGDDDHVPPRIEDLVEAAQRSGAVRAHPVPVSAPDFHGDGADSEVAVVWTDRQLRNEVDSAGAQHATEYEFARRAATRPGEFARLGSLDERFTASFAAPVSVMRRLEPRRTLFFGRQFHAHGLLFLSSAPAHSLGRENPVDDVPRATEVFGDAADALAGFEHSDDRGDVNLGTTAASCNGDHIGVVEDSIDTVLADAQLARDIRNERAGPVELDRIASMERREFHGHVFNLETEDGFYGANGIITHNCRCTTIPVLNYSALGVDTPSTPERQTYPQWFDNQSAAVQDDILGPSRGAMVRSGKITFSDMVNRDGSRATLAELRALGD